MRVSILLTALHGSFVDEMTGEMGERTMSFTKEEIQSFNTILEQKLTQQRRELERSFDQRLQVFKREIDQRLVFTQQDLVRVLSQHHSEQYRKLKEVLNQRNEAQARIPSTVISEAELKQQLEDVVEHALDTQLISFDQLIGERFAPVDENAVSIVEAPPNFADMELHTEIPLDDLAEAVNKALDERFSSLDTSLRQSITGIERYLATRLQTLHEELMHDDLSHTHDTHIVQAQQFDGTITNMQDVFTSIERLERIIESMQVAMTSNHALLSNRMYHHQQLPLERAHPNNQDAMNQNFNNATKGSLPLSKE